MNHSTYILLALTATFVLGGCRSPQNTTSSLGRSYSEPVVSIRPGSSALPDVEQAQAIAPELTGVVTLAEAAAMALMHNPQLGAAAIGRRAAEARELQAGLRPNPELSVEIESLAGTGDQSGFDGAETTMALAQLIESWGKRDKRVHVASLETELADWDLESERLDLLQEVTRTFVGVLAAQERLALGRQLDHLSREAQSTVAQRVEAGRDSAIENLRASVVLSMSRIELQKAERALATARQNLAATWGARAASFEEAEGDFYAVVAAPSISDVSEAIAANPDVARWVVEHRRRKAALELEKTRTSSDMVVTAGVQRFEETDDSAFVVGLALPIPLFSRNQGGIAEATANLAKARRQAEATEAELVAMLNEAINELAATYEEVQVLRADVLPKAQQAFEAAQEGYREGKFDYLYVLDTQRTFFEMQVRYIDAVEACHLARADVERLTGRPLSPGR